MTDEKIGKLGIYRVVPTEDGGSTLWSQAFDENCHSLKGPRGETQEIYLDGCQVIQKARQRGVVRVLEVGFGTGLGLKMTAEALRQQAPEAELWFISLELDSALVDWARPKIQSLRYARPYETDWGAHIVSHDRLHTFGVLIGDARQTLPLAVQDPLFKDFFPVDCIYQDPFSPKKNPELWSADWFRALKALAAPQAILSTYSAAKLAKRSLQEAGWTVEEKPGFAGKLSSTRATIGASSASGLSE